VNGDEDRDLAGAFKIQGFPTIKLFGSTFKKTPDGKGVMKEPEDYNGPRTATDMAKFALSKLPNFVTKVTSKNVEEVLAGSPDLAKVLLFTNKKETTPLYKALAVDYHYQLNLGEVKDTEKDVVSRFGVTKYPTLVVVPVSGDQVVYDGELKHEALSKFLKPFAKEIPKPGPSSGSKKSTAPPPPPPPTEPVRPVRGELVDQQTFESLCFDKTVNCIISLLDPQNTEPEEHERYLSVLEKIQDKHSKTFNFFWMDAQKQLDFVEKWNLASGFPAAVVFNHKKMTIVPYVGAFAEENMSEFLNSLLIRGVTRRATPIDKVPTVRGVQKEKDEL